MQTLKKENQTNQGQSIVVAKFGGTSMADEVAMRRSAQVSMQRNASIVVVSATAGTTNQLLEVANNAIESKEAQTNLLIDKIKARHLELAHKLEVTDQTLEQLNGLFEELETLAKGILLLRDCWPKTRDGLVSLGERMSSLLFSECMSQLYSSQNETPKSVELLDVREVLATDDRHERARPNFNKIEILCQQHLTAKLPSTVFVTQGFMGRGPSGATTTLGRGGSDYSAAILAWGVDADVLEIWTDVPGIATTDPRICPSAQIISEISFQEAAELATFGAKILHPTTLAPAGQKNIPVFVGSSYDPDKGGTWIVSQIEDEKTPLVRALAMRKDQTLLTITTPKMLQTHGFLYQIFKIFNDYQVSIDAITTSEISVALTLDKTDASNDELLEELKRYADISLEHDLELVSLIGNRINHTPGLGEKIFNCLGDINVRMICHGASRHNFCFIVKKDQGAEAISRLHNGFITN